MRLALPPPLPAPLVAGAGEATVMHFYRHQVMLKAALIGDSESYLAVACFSFSRGKMDPKKKKPVDSTERWAAGRVGKLIF